MFVCNTAVFILGGACLILMLLLMWRDNVVQRWRLTSLRLEHNLAAATGRKARDIDDIPDDE